MEVFDVLLQIFDDGRLTDGHGRTVDFRNTVVIMTSNLRSLEEVRATLRPEFVKRIDEIVVFERLTREQLAEIVELRSCAAWARGSPSAASRIELTDAAKELVAEAGWDPQFGARPLKRALQRLVENPVALRLLEGEFREGDAVRVDAQNGELVFEKAPGRRARGRLSRNAERAQTMRRRALALTRHSRWQARTIHCPRRARGPIR